MELRAGDGVPHRPAQDGVQHDRLGVRKDVGGCLSRIRVVILWRTFLPYSLARLRSVAAEGERLRVDAYGLEVTRSDPTYEFLKREQDAGDRLRTCFPGRPLTDLRPSAVSDEVTRQLTELDPQVVFGPATPFAEGMAAIRWCLRHRRRVFLMDDAWEATDFRGGLVTAVKRKIHECVDGVLVPDRAYESYWRRLGVPEERVIPGVDVVDNDFFASPAGSRRHGFLFVGRDVPRKGLGTLLDAYAQYRGRAGEGAWPLRVAGPTARDPVTAPAGVVFLGALSGVELRQAYWDAAVLVVPSHFEQWGLVINEGMAAGLPVLSTATVGAARALVEQGITGWLVQPQDPVLLADALGQIAALPRSAISRAGTAARRTVEAKCALALFPDAIGRAMALPSRRPPTLASRLLARAWMGSTRSLS